MIDLSIIFWLIDWLIDLTLWWWANKIRFLCVTVSWCICACKKTTTLISVSSVLYKNTHIVSYAKYVVYRNCNFNNIKKLCGMYLLHIIILTWRFVGDPFRWTLVTLTHHVCSLTPFHHVLSQEKGQWKKEWTESTYHVGSNCCRVMWLDALHVSILLVLPTTTTVVSPEPFPHRSRALLSL